MLLEFFTGLKYYNKDERIDTFSQFIPAVALELDGRVDRKYQKEIFDLFLKLIKSLSQPLNIILGDNQDKTTFDVNFLYDKAANEVLKNATLPLKI
mmetsp:Transcript_19718/g.18783  ORF Transcript_19718/g.18783 Transcript_19718/m.18783 type:complete len:96 (-) Transcript_19718:726-1013(-)